MTETVEPEIWKPVPNPTFASCYEVSDLGRVRRAPTAPRRQRAVLGKVLDGFVNKDSGLIHVTLRSEIGTQGTFAVHRLVCEAFYGPPISGMVRAVHRTAALQDNRATNVAWSNTLTANPVSRFRVAPAKPERELGAIVWKPVPGYEDEYIAGSHGEIRRVGAEKDLAGYRPDDKHHTVVLSRNGIQRTLSIHKLICLAFHGPAPFLNALVRHLDDVKSNNRADNLAWGTAIQNTDDAFRNGKMAVGSRNPLSKLLEDHVHEIKRLHREGWSQVEIAKQSKKLFGVRVRNTQVHHIVTGKQWKHVS